MIFDITLNGHSISNRSQFDREIKKSILAAAREDVNRKIRGTGARARVVERRGKTEIELTGSDEAVEKAKKRLGH